MLGLDESRAETTAFGQKKTVRSECRENGLGPWSNYLFRVAIVGVRNRGNGSTRRRGRSTCTGRSSRASSSDAEQIPEQIL